MFQESMIYFCAGPFPAKWDFEDGHFKPETFPEFDKIPNSDYSREYLYKRIVGIENRFSYRPIFKIPSFDASIDLVPSPIPYALIYLLRERYKNTRDPKKLMLKELERLSDKFGHTLTAYLWEKASTPHSSSIRSDGKKPSAGKTKALEWYLASSDN